MKQKWVAGYFSKSKKVFFLLRILATTSLTRLPPAVGGGHEANRFVLGSASYSCGVSLDFELTRGRWVKSDSVEFLKLFWKHARCGLPGLADRSLWMLVFLFHFW